MSPDLYFIFLLLLRMAIAAAFVVSGTIVMGLIYVVLAQRHGLAVSCGSAIVVWIAIASVIRLFDWTLTAGLAVNFIAFGICIPLLAQYRHVKMPLVTRRWYDIPFRAALVATLVAIVVSTSGWVGSKISGIIALYPIVFSSMMVILHPRIGGPPTAAVLANSAWGLLGFGMAIAVVHVAVAQFGSAIGLSLALATCIGWNLTLWWNGRRKRIAH